MAEIESGLLSFSYLCGFLKADTGHISSCGCCVSATEVQKCVTECVEVCDGTDRFDAARDE